MALTPLRILHVANYNILKYGDAYYSVGRALANGLIRAGHFVYEFSHRDVARTENPFRAKALGTQRMNRRLLECVDRLRPDLLLLGHSELVAADTLETIRTRHRLPMAMWYVDPVYPEVAQKLEHIHQRLHLLDVFFCTTGGDDLARFATPSTRARFFPNPVDPSVNRARNHERSEFSHDLIFCGRDKHDPGRRGFIDRLGERLGGEVRFRTCGCLGQPPAFGDAYMEALRESRMGLNYSRRNDVCLYSSDRIAHLTGNGLLAFCPETPGFDALYRPDEVVYFTGLEDLADKIRFHADNDAARRQVAGKGWRRAHSAFDATRVARYLVEEILGLAHSAEYEWTAIRC